MNENQIIKNTVEYVKKSLEKEECGHDWWHAYRVYQMAKYIAKKEGGNLFVIKLASLLHDIADWKFHGGSITKGSELAREWLGTLNVKKSIITHVCYIIENISFKGAGVSSEMKTIEGKIVQDADRLDAIGAIGIARCFAYGGYKGRPIYDPKLKPTLHKSFEEYKTKSLTSINHFYEKLLLLKDRMNTKTGRKIAEKKYKFMEVYLKRFFKEWEGRI